MEKVLEEARGLAARGVKELIVVAQDITRYGTDWDGRPHLAELLEALCRMDFPWIRLHYLYPDMMDERLIAVIAGEPKILKYLDIPLQHCNNGILRRMNRRGDTSRYSGFPLWASSFASSSMAFKPAGVQAQPSPNTLAITFVAMYPSAGCPLGIRGNRKRRRGAIPLVSFSTSPALCAISINPIHRATTPAIVIHRETASPALSSAAFVTSLI